MTKDITNALKMKPDYAWEVVDYLQDGCEDPRLFFKLTKDHRSIAVYDKPSEAFLGYLG